jgi:hypothetical protein
MIEAELGISNKSATAVTVTTLWNLFKRHYILVPIIWLAFRFLFRRYSSPLRVLPGPLLASGSRLWLGVFNVV